MVGIHEARLTEEQLPASLQQVVSYWQNLKSERMAPSWREFDLLAVPAELLPTTVVVDCEADSRDQSATAFRYRFYGSGLRAIHGVELTGKTPDDLPIPTLAHRIKSEFEAVRESCAPIFSAYNSDILEGMGDFLNVARLPLSNDGMSVSNILSVIFYKRQDRDLVALYERLNALIAPAQS